MATADEMERAAKRDAPNPRDPWPELGKIAKTIGDRNVKFNETVTPSTDFRDGKALELAELDYHDTTRELSKAAKRMEEVQNQRTEAMAEPGYFLGDGSAAEVPYRDFLSEQAALDTYWKDLGKAPSSADEAQYWNKIVAAAAEQGVKVDPADAKNLTDWRLVNFASDRMVKLLVADPVKNALAVENIAESLSQVSPEMASMGFMLANTKFEELAKDPNLAQKGVGFMVEILGAILEPFVVANEEVQQNWRANAYNAREIERDGGSGLRQLYGSIAGVLGYNRSMVEEGDYDETYLATIPTALDSQGKRLFTDIEIEIAMLLHMGKAKDPEFNPNFAVEEFLLNKQGEDYAEGYRAFGNIISNTGPRADAMATLMRQIDSAHDGNTGMIGSSTVSSQNSPEGFGNKALDFVGLYQTDNPAPVVYDPQRGEGSYQFVSNLAGFATSVILDPTIVVAATYRGVQATRYALSQVAPQASMNAVGAEKLLSSGGGFLGLNNKTHRFFKTLSGELNEYEILGARVQRNNAGKFASNEAEEVARLKGIVDENNAYVKNATASAKIDGRVDPIEKTVQAAFDEDLLAYQKAVKAESKAQKRVAPVTPDEQAQRVAEDQIAYDALRQRISRRYNQIPDDLITDILATAPRVNKNGVIVPRVSADGTINEGRITAESIAEFANNKNNEYVFEIANIERVALAQGQLASDLPRIVADLLDQKHLESFDQALSRGVKKTKRAEMTPQMTSGTVVRSRISNWIASNVMTDRASAKILQEYVDTTSAKTISKSFSDNAVQIGQESKNVASGGLTPSFTEGSGLAGVERVAGVGDSLGRMFSSISRLSMIDLSNGDAAEEVYKYARQFLPKGLAETAANAFRNGDFGSRRILMSGIVRAAAQSRGLVLPKGAIDAWQHRSATAMNVTGTRKGESYGAAFKPSEMPTVKLANQQDQLFREDEIRRAQTVADEDADLVENVIKQSDGLERLSYSFGKNDEVVFLGVDETFESSLSAKPVTSVQANPEGLLEEALKRNPNDQKLQSMLTNIKNKEFGEDEVELLDNIIAALAVDGAGKMSKVEQTSGFALVLSALTGNAKAKKVLDSRAKLFKENLNKTRKEQFEEAKESNKKPGSNAEPVEYSEIASVRSTDYPVTKDAQGNVSLDPHASYTPGSARASIHFTINSEVKSHMGGQWNDTNQLIVTNTEKVVKANGVPSNINPVDSWWSLGPGEKLKLPKASVVNPYIDEAGYVKELEKRGLIKPGEKPPVVVEDTKTNDVFYFSKPADQYTDADRAQILEAVGRSSDEGSVAGLVGKESVTLRRHALDLAMRQQKVSSGPMPLAEWGYDVKTELTEKIYALNVRDGISGSIHQGTPAQRLELSRGADPWNRFDGDELETYRWIVAQGLVKTETKTPSIAGSRISDDYDLTSAGVVDNAAMRNPLILKGGGAKSADRAENANRLDFPNDPASSPPKILTLTDSEDSILSGDFAQGMTGWRNQVLDDKDLYASFKISELGTGTTVKEFKITAKAYKPEQWIDDIVEETGLPPRAPWNVGAVLNKSQENRFITEGTISREALQEIEAELGPEKFLQWMLHGETDEFVKDLPTPQGAVSRVRDVKGEIPGWDGVPDEWLFGADWSSKWIPVPWAKGGITGRGVSRNKTEEAERLFKENNDEIDIRFDEEFASGSLDEQLDDWMISRRDQGDPRFQPAPARVPVVDPLYREPVLRDLDDSGGVRSLSADGSNVESALHMYQTRTHMRVPNLGDFEDMRKNQGAFGRGMYAAHKVSEEYTNFWSIFTLFGWRFSIRNAVEEVGMWFGTAGSVVDLAKGRAASTNRRRVDREMYVMEPTFASSDDAIPKVVYKAEQGLIGRTVESLRVKGQEASGNTNRTAAAWQREWSEAQGLPGYLMRYFVIPAMGPRTKNLEAIKKAQIKSKFSDPKTNDEFVAANKDRNDLIAEGIVGSRVGRVGLLNESDAQIIRLAGENSHFVHLLDDINQSGTYINSARNPAGLASGRQQLDANEELPPGVLPGRIDQEAAQAALNKAIDDANISGMTIQRISGTSMKDVNSKKMVDEWHHILRATLQGGDELTSTIAVQGIADISRGLTTSARVKTDLADVIRNDPDGKYQEMFSRLSDDDSITQFASDYFDDILNMFQTQEGGISTRLLDMFTDTNGVYQGWAKQVDSTLVNKLDLDLGVSVDMTDRVTAQMLRGIPLKERPTVMTVDRNGEQYIPYANTLPAIVSLKYSDRLYRWMGRQNARLSREPIFWGNVLGMWSMSTVRRTNLSKRIAEAKGQVWDELDDAAKLRAEDMANQLVSKDVFDRAYSVTVSFMDNPSNRSNLAWKARNVSRYYRASEDFYRRMGRVAVSNPEAYAKFAIGYSLLDDTGLVYTDDNGDKYFQYPMNQVVQDTMNWFLMKSSGLSDMETGSGFVIGGKILGSTPSLDPMNMLPPLTSGTGSLIGAAAFRLPYLKELAGARALVMGQFNQPSGDLTTDIMAAVMPAGLTRIWGMIDTDARESNSASTTMDAIAIMSAEGHFDTITLSDGSTIDKDFATEEEILNSKEMRVANLVATGLELTKLVFAHAGPSFPMINADNVSQWARMNGYDNMTDGWYDFQDDVAFDPEYLDMVEEFTQDKIYDPWGQAAQKWYLMRAGEELDDDNEFGWVGSFVPYTVSGSESTGSSVLKQASFRATEEGYKFLTNSETGYASFPDEFKAASLFLAPREGAFDWAAHLYAKNLLSLRVPKATNELAVEIVRSEAIAEKRRAALSYAQRIDALDKNAPAYEQQVSLLNKQKSAEWADKGYSGVTDNVYAFQDMEINRDDANESYIAVKKMLAWKKDNEGLDVFPAGSTEALMEEAITIWDESLMELKVYAGSNYDRARKDIKAERTAKLDALQLGNAQVKHFRDSTMWG